MTDGANAAGLSYIRVALGATDFSASGPPYPRGLVIVL